LSPRDTASYGRLSFGLGGSGGPPPRDLLIILGTLFVTFSLQFFAATAVVPELLRLTPLVWRAGFVWQLLTYPFIGYGGASIWILIELLILFMFGRDVYAGLGRKHFWRLVLITAAVAGGIALLVEALGGVALPPGAVAASAGAAGASRAGIDTWGQQPYFPLLQGQRVLLAMMVAAFATANRRATILLFFVLPVEARFFLPLEIVFAFIGYLQTRDLAGFLGICVAVGLTFLYVRDGGFGRGLRQSRLRLERWWLQRKLARTRRRSGMRVVKGSGGGARGGPWLN
jgi:hypothetical protein